MQRRSHGRFAFFSSRNAPLSERFYHFDQGVIPGGFRPRLPDITPSYQSTAVPSSQPHALVQRTSPKDVDDLDAKFSEQVLEASYRINLTECRVLIRVVWRKGIENYVTARGIITFAFHEDS